MHPVAAGLLFKNSANLRDLRASALKSDLLKSDLITLATANHNSGRQTICIWWWPVEAIFAANRVAQLYAATRFFFSPRFLSCAFLVKKVAKPL